MRIGQGFDVHAFGPGNEIILGGVHIAHTHGIKAHSDGDVLLHAICNALLGAAALGDIGRHFPDNDSRWRGADSRKLLAQVLTLLTERGFKPMQVDATIIAQAPKMAPHIAAMCANIASDLKLPRDCVNVKAATTEGLGYIGRGEGLAVQAVVLVDTDS
ncbi:MAG: 2-C-methyl-D-erythritol 2,4-cyclodiphosphate synthase [Gammaproteobacteria bacterium]|nr:2-C-methyl-D-erythritol 2,4-cyclodiphosphate synthase [Gammaproteobacteria bacterium]MDE2023233.1 2-C-methyl-D-erythritol 2,4-cyclodiphosphate synthase [Gammaproteobacteria bacterium]MDE2140153.1 2-C-methyl-D-erythritol 2,4-cyclodiphosphate synthase [Gammaproteobacteria bacterium]MDE2273937.1 2-C-methyl-D-erythritol 2,4-cyclodiphosphate synthase [Gammaproteobacteria bacterium]